MALKDNPAYEEWIAYYIKTRGVSRNKAKKLAHHTILQKQHNPLED